MIIWLILCGKVEFVRYRKKKIHKSGPYGIQFYKLGPSSVALFFAGMAVASWLVFITITGYPLFIYAYYKVRPDVSSRLAALLRERFYDYEDAIRYGVWRVPDLDTPDFNRKPVMLVAHRFGYLEWTRTYRKENSFYNLPKLDVGDEVEIYWDQRKYLYRVTKKEEGTEITDFAADLILYTCKFLVSDIRVLVYAERIN